MTTIPVNCPGCGSNSFKKTADNRAKCLYCGTEFILNSREDEPEGTEKPDERKCSKCEIIPEYSTDLFTREVWIKMAKEDVPFDVFKEDLSDVKLIEHQVLVNSITADLTYQASIGYDRQESYTDYEDYWEDEPYYENGQKKTRSVKKQRMVTKYRTVTDWQPFSGNTSADSVAEVENVPGLDLDLDLFKSSFTTFDKETSLKEVSDEKSKEMNVTNSSLEAAAASHHINLYASLLRSLPGDRNRDLDFRITRITKSSSVLCVTPEYETSVTYNGKTYSKRAFPFGVMEIGGDRIPNEEDLDTIVKKKKDAIPGMIWNKTKLPAIIATAAPATSILVSFFIHVLPLVIIFYLAAVAAFVFYTVLSVREGKNITSAVNAETEEFTLNYKQKQRDLLDGKLRSLGDGPLGEHEL